MKGGGVWAGRNRKSGRVLKPEEKTGEKRKLLVVRQTQCRRRKSQKSGQAEDLRRKPGYREARAPKIWKGSSALEKFSQQTDAKSNLSHRGEGLPRTGQCFQKINWGSKQARKETTKTREKDMLVENV